MKAFLIVLFICMNTISFGQIMQKKLDSLFRTYYSTNKPGAAISVLLGGKLFFQKGYGLADASNNNPVTASSVFNIGSLTKQFTAYSILKLVAEHHLSLNDSLLKFFPHFSQKPGSMITIRELLSHSSGILDHYDHVDTKDLRHATNQTVLKAVENLDSTYFLPGSRYRYSNTAYCLLGLIIEKVSGLSYRDYLKKNIFQPLGMTHSEVWSEGLTILNRAIGYDTSGAQKTFSILDADQSVFFSTESDGGIYTTIEDYLKWITALQTETILNKSLIKQSRSPQFVIDSAQSLYYGFGWFIKLKGKEQAVYHTGSNGGFRAMSFTIPSRHDAIVIFSNRDDIDLEKLLTEVLDILHINEEYFTKINALVSFNYRWPNFAPCKETTLFSISSIKNLNVSDMALN
jgi:CubicO group peptidase (beta-lactamase class C family)